MKSQQEIRDMATQLKKESERAYREFLSVRDRLTSLQEECQHPNVDTRLNGELGNYDRDQSLIWHEHRCRDCDKFWTTECRRTAVI